MGDKLSWINADGTEYPLDVILPGMKGRFMPSLSFVEEEVPFQPGSKLRNIKVKSRDVDIPLHIYGESEIELRQKLRDILRSFNPFKGDGKLRIVAPDGSQRELICRYSTGLEGNETKDSKGLSWMNVVLVFRAFDPYWYDTATQVKTFSTGQTATFFPLFPLRLSSSTVFADASIDNVGDVETWPEWIIKGPGADIVLRNLRTGEVIRFDHPDAVLETGESIIIDTSPFKKTVTKHDGTNLFYTLADESSLWALQEGTNNIRLEMSNATQDSSIQVSYRNRFWGP